MVRYGAARFRQELEVTYGKEHIPEREREALERWEELSRGTDSTAARAEIATIIEEVAKPWVAQHPMIRFDVEFPKKP